MEEFTIRSAYIRSEAPAEFARSVFMNHSYAPAFLKTRLAMAFAIVDLGFVPVTADSVVDSGAFRLEKIFRLITGCQYSVHDVSAAPTANIPRNNMPLELGLDIMARHLFSGHYLTEKRSIVLVSKWDDYTKSISDLAGMDPEAHGGDPDVAAEAVVSFLRPHAPARRSADEVQDDYSAFLSELPSVLKSLGYKVPALEKCRTDRPSEYYRRMVEAMREWRRSRDALTAATPKRAVSGTSRSARKAASKRAPVARGRRNGRATQ